MRKTYLLLTSLLIALTLSSCNLVSDYGRTSDSDVKGYLEYTNKTLNISVLTPVGWKTRVTIGGEYTMRPDDSHYDGISVAQSNIERMLGKKASKTTTLKEYHLFRLSQINEEMIGPEPTVSEKKTSLSGHDAYEIYYTSLPEGETQKLFAKETYTLI